MIEIKKSDELDNFSIGIVEVIYSNKLNIKEFYELVDKELDKLYELSTSYDRKLIFGDNSYYRFFKKFKKTYPVLLQYESIIFKNREFPKNNPIIEIPFLLELTTLVLSGTHDVTKIEGPVNLCLSHNKTSFEGMRGEAHTYPGDLFAMDNRGIIFSEIAGSDARTCASKDSTHVIYPIFGVPDINKDIIANAISKLISYINVLCPDAKIEYKII